MIAIGIILLYAFAIIYCSINKKSSICWVLLSTIVSPRIAFGTSKIDGVYLLVIILTMFLFLKRKIHKMPSYFLKYTSLLIVVHFVYIFSWISFNRNGGTVLLTSIFGAVKLVLMLWICYELNRNINIEIKSEIHKLIMIVLCLNGVAVIYEMMDLQGSTQFLSNVFLNNSEIVYLTDTTRWGYYARYCGLFHYPMHMGLFMSYAFALELFWDNEKRFLKIICMISTIVLGLYSGSKSFIIGTAIVFLAYILVLFRNKKYSKKTLSTIGVSIFLLLALIIFYDQIYLLIYDTMGAGVARYFGFIKNYGEILSTRFDSDSGALVSTIDVIKNNILFGVGPDSLSGEPVMDNAYIMILHNGGLVALLIILAFYYKLTIKLSKNQCALLMIIALFVTGMGFQTIFSTDTTIWVMYYLLWEASNIGARNSYLSQDIIGRRNYVESIIY